MIDDVVNVPIPFLFFLINDSTEFSKSLFWIVFFLRLKAFSTNASRRYKNNLTFGGIVHVLYVRASCLISFFIVRIVKPVVLSDFKQRSVQKKT